MAFYVGTFLFGFFSVGVGAFVIGLSQIFSCFAYERHDVRFMH